MIKKINISYGMSTDKKVSVGEFEAEIYDEIEESLESIIGVLNSRISLKNLKKINITIEEISTIEEEEEEEE